VPTSLHHYQDDQERPLYDDENIRSSYVLESPGLNEDSRSYGEGTTIGFFTPQGASFDDPLPPLPPLPHGPRKPVPGLPNEAYAHEGDDAHKRDNLIVNHIPLLLGRVLTPTSPVSPTYPQISSAHARHELMGYDSEAPSVHDQSASHRTTEGGNRDVPQDLPPLRYTQGRSLRHAQGASLETLGKALPATPPQGIRRGDQIDDQSEILAPHPRRDRDTIHHIVDQYGDSDREEGHVNPYPQLRTSTISTASSEWDASDSAASVRRYSGDGEVVDGMEDGGEGGEVLMPPGPIFDLTPGREPSPGRYKHGEPLQLGESCLQSSLPRFSFLAYFEEECLKLMLLVSW